MGERAGQGRTWLYTEHQLPKGFAKGQEDGAGNGAAFGAVPSALQNTGCCRGAWWGWQTLP